MPNTSLPIAELDKTVDELNKTVFSQFVCFILALPAAAMFLKNLFPHTWALNVVILVIAVIALVGTVVMMVTAWARWRLRTYVEREKEKEGLR